MLRRETPPALEMEKERDEGKKLDQSLSGERFNEDDLILLRGGAARPSKRILTSIAGRESSGENCRQLFPKSRADAPALSAREYSRVCESVQSVRERERGRRGGGGSAGVVADPDV